MSSIVLDNPLTLLKREADSIRTVIAKIDGDIRQLNDQVTELMVQKASLNLVVNALDNEMDRIRTAPVQLELDLEVE
jgi:predicted  nucleic acid-binding Zn-ribbon protein